MTGTNASATATFGTRRIGLKHGFVLLVCIAAAACGGGSHDVPVLSPTPSPTMPVQPSPTAAPTATPHVASGELDQGFGHDGFAILTDLNGVTTARRGLFTFADGRTVVLALEHDENGAPTELLRFEIAADGRGDVGPLSTASRPLPLLVPVVAAVTPDGGAIVLGRPTGETGHLVAARLTPEGDLDAKFGDGGLSAIDLDYAIVLPLRDGRTVIAGGVEPSTQALMRLAPDGSIDRTFGRDGFAAVPVPSETDPDEFYVLTDLAVTQEGRILVAVSDHKSISQDPLLIAFTSTGEIDRAFGDGGILHYGIFGAGGMLSVGLDSNVYWYVRGRLLQIGTDGSLTELVIDRKTFSADFDALIGATDGSVVLAGSGFVPDVPRRFDCRPNSQGVCIRGAIVVQSLTAAGILDLGFGNSGTTVTDFPAPYGAPNGSGTRAVVAAPEGRLTLLANACDAQGHCDYMLLRYGAP